jgi:hypothetical protein
MSNQNRPFQVLVPTYASLLGAGARIETLAVGQIGFFNAETNLSFVAATVVATPEVARNFYIAVGVDRSGDATVDDVVKSAGDHIQATGIDNYDVQCYAAAAPKIVDLMDFVANCDTDYAVKLEIRNQASYRSHGFNQATETYSVHTDCCDECADCPTGDCTDLAEKLVTDVNRQEETWTTATYRAYAGQVIVSTGGSVAANFTVTIGTTVITVASAGGTDPAADAAAITAAINADGTYDASDDGVDTVTIVGANATDAIATDPLTTAAAFVGSDTALANVDAFTGTDATTIETFRTLYPDSCVGVRFTTSPIAIETYCKVNLKYFQPRGTNVIVSLVQGSGFDCSGALTTVQELTFESGSGYDIAQLEFVSGGWNGKPGPYRQSTLAGESVGNFDSFAVKASHYVQINLGYLNKAQSGWQQYESPIETIIAVLCADTEDGDLGDLIINTLDAIVGWDVAGGPAVAIPSSGAKLASKTVKLVACGTSEFCPDL